MTYNNVFPAKENGLSLEDELLKQRWEKLSEIEKLGHHAYGRRYDFTHAIPQILSEYGSKTAEELSPEFKVRIAGRVKTIRSKGKAGFAHLAQNGEQLQIYVRSDAVSANDFRLFQILDIGDLIGAEGYLFRTRTGELTVHVERLEFLSKTLFSMPEKWHGLEDVEMRYRQRYLDLIANPESRKVFVTRSKIISSFRRQLEERGFIEVETPMMQPLYGGATARPFVTHHNTLDIDLYLRIAPELYLKRLVVGGLERVYEINRNFRNEGLGFKYNPEFTMLEFYQAYTDYRGMMDLSAELLKQVSIDATGSTEVEWDGARLDFGSLARFSMREAIIEFWESADRPTLDNVRDTEWLKRHSSKSNSGEALAEIFERVAEAKLVQPTIIYDFPVETSPLSKNKPDEPELVERFEIFAGGMEIGNAYTELNDPQEQRRRFEMQIGMRERGNEEAHQMDEDYVRALCFGMPPTGGEGIGIDRLTMLLTGSRTIRDVILFPLLRPEGEIGVAERLRALES
ncbi:MAG TPA: lysine--tRNA ligase [Candidatus Acidoferrum sp.]|nr:lysine--tRNA ligase [Candidatus Acidoferrum sp.]